jgi:proteasome lid subunit RPN8/RPN11
VIAVARPLADAIAAAARTAYPEECCGLLVGRRLDDGSIVVSGIEPSPNVAAAARRRDRFEVDPGLRLRLMRRLAGSGDAIVGHYHSHPDHPALPSAHDRAMAFEPDLVWVIVSVDARGATGIAAYAVDAAGFRSLALHIGDAGRGRDGAAD